MCRKAIEPARNDDNEQHSPNSRLCWWRVGNSKAARPTRCQPRFNVTGRVEELEPMKRKSLSKKLRFEVFKRDKFRCQYCGRPSPEVVLLVVDHVEPVSKGGTDDILNLITSCEDCNSGKGAVRLSDGAALEKTRAQLELLEEKRQQLEMLIQWKKGLSDIKQEAADKAADFWSELAPGLTPNDNGRGNLRKWIKKYGFEAILDAMRIAADSYLVFDGDGKATDDSWERAFLKIPGIAYLNGVPEGEKQAYYIRGILKRRFPDDWKAQSNRRCAELLAFVQNAISVGVPADEITSNAKTARSWAQFESGLIARINDEQKRGASPDA
jgi:5-methylcytosine-specific restriction endonuclease McrA